MKEAEKTEFEISSLLASALLSWEFAKSVEACPPYKAAILVPLREKSEKLTMLLLAVAVALLAKLSPFRPWASALPP